MAVALTGRLTDFGIFGGIVPIEPCSMTAFGTRSPWGSTSANGTPSNDLRRPVLEDQARVPGSSLGKHPLRGGRRRDLAEVERQVLPLLREELEQVGQPLGRDRFSNPSGMSDFFEDDELLDVLTQDRVLLPLGVEQVDRGLRLPREQAVQDAAVAVATVYWRKFPSTDRLGSRIWTSSSSLGCAAMPVRSGPTLPPSPEWVWHLAHFALEDLLARGGVAAIQDGGATGLDDLLAIRIGQPAAPGEQGLGPFGDRLVRMGCQGLRLVERQRDSGTLPASIRSTSAFVQSVLPSRARTLALRAAGVIGPIASTRAEPTSAVAARHGGDQAARQVGRGLRGHEGDHVARGLRVGLAEVDQLPGGVDAGARASLVGGRGEEVPRRARRRTRRAPCTPSVRRGRASARGSRSRASAGGRRGPVSEAASSFGALSLGQPFANPAIIASADEGVGLATADIMARSCRPARPGRGARPGGRRS